MDKAKENYKIGEVRIVNSEQIKRQYNRSISYEEKKFFCTNCGEYVTYVNRDKGKTFFRHIKKTDETKECELRIDAQSQVSVYQKVGLPIYLKKDSYNNFNLFVGFYAIDQHLMRKSYDENISITMLGVKSSSNFRKKYCVNDINFSSEITTLKQVNFLSSKYRIEYSNSQAENLLLDKWGYEIEGINTEGALFKYGEYGGRKIRINEEIITDTEYICITRNDSIFRYLSGIKYEDLGGISLLNGSFKVYKIRFNLNGWDNKGIIEFCRERFKVSLVNKASEIISIWPPTISDDKKIELFFEKNNLLLLKSSQSNAKAFIHRMKYNKEISLNKVDENKYAFKVSPSSNERAININDEYNSEYVLVYNYKDKIKTFTNEIIIKDVNENIIEKGTYNKLTEDNIVKIYSNSEVDIIHYRKGIIFKSYKIKSKETIINNLKYGDKLDLKIGLKKKSILEFEKLKEEITRITINDLEIYRKLKRLNGKLEPVDAFTKMIYIKLKDYPRTSNLIKSFISKNKMPIGAKKILKNINIR